MNPLLGAAALSAGSNLLGGLLGRKSTRDANAANYAMQKEFAQHGVSWKVEDARRAGIHPALALGSMTTSAAPSYVGDQSMPNALSGMSQSMVGMAMQNQLMNSKADLDLKKSTAELNRARAIEISKPKSLYEWRVDDVTGQAIQIPATDLPLELQSEILYAGIGARPEKNLYTLINAPDVQAGKRIPPNPVGPRSRKEYESYRMW